MLDIQGYPAAVGTEALTLDDVRARYGERWELWLDADGAHAVRKGPFLAGYASGELVYCLHARTPAGLIERLATAGAVAGPGGLRGGAHPGLPGRPPRAHHIGGRPGS